MAKSETLKKLALYKKNPDLTQDMTPNEIADIAILMLSQVSVIEQAIKDGRIDGKTPVADKDYISKATMRKLLTEAVNDTIRKFGEISDNKNTKHSATIEKALTRVRDGKDGVVTETEIQRAAELAGSLVDLPDFEKIVDDKIKVLGSKKFSQEAITDLPTDLTALREAVNSVSQSKGGTIGKRQVYNFIEQAIADGTIASSGDMTKAVYDPTTVAGDTFDMDNMVEGTTTKILTSTERSEIAANTAKLTANTANVTTAGAVMDSELTSETDVKALDQDVTSGATPTFTNTNISEATDKNYVTDAEATVIGNTSGTNTGDETLSSIETLGFDVVGQTSVASDTTPNPVGSEVRNEYYLTALAGNATFSAPSGTPANGNSLVIRILDNSTSRTLAWNAIYRGMADTLPAATTIDKTMYVGFKYNSADTKWDMVALNEEA